MGGYTLILFICLNFQLSYSQSTFKGKPCDDTEVRNYAGLPAWKNYGEWLSECDSLEDAWEDSIFVTIHKNPKNLRDIDKIEKYIVTETYEEYEEYIKNK